jgi:hypothetical protein
MKRRSLPAARPNAIRFEGTVSVAKLSIAWWLFGAALVLLAPFSIALELFFVFPLIGVSLFALYKLALRARASDYVQRAAVVNAAGLFLDGKRVLARDAIVAAYHEERRGQHVVVFESRWPWRTYTVRVDSPDASRAILDALMLSSRPVHFYARSPLSKVGAIAVVAIPLLSHVFGRRGTIEALNVGFAAVTVMFVAVLLMQVSQRIDVGRDGVLVRWFHRTRFIAFRDIVSIEKTHAQITLTLRGASSAVVKWAVKDPDALYRAIKVAMDAQPQTSASELGLSRAGRDVATWERDVRALLQGGGYRSQALTRERLWEVVEDASVDASTRAGAALALSADLDADERARIEAIAADVASPRLRVALQSALMPRVEGEALAEIEDEVDVEPQALRRQLDRRSHLS